MHQFDDQLLGSLIEDCNDIHAKCKTALNLYAIFTRIVAGNDPASSLIAAATEWSSVWTSPCHIAR